MTAQRDSLGLRPTGVLTAVLVGFLLVVSVLFCTHRDAAPAAPVTGHGPVVEQTLGSSFHACEPVPMHEHRHDTVVTPNLAPRDRLALGLGDAVARVVCTEPRAGVSVRPTVTVPEALDADLSQLGVRRV